MPKNITNALKIKLASDSFSLATIATITRRDGIVLALTSWDVPIVYAGNTYQPTGGILPQSVKNTSDSGTDSMDIKAIISSGLFTDYDIINGRYDDATILIQQIDPTDIASGVITMLSGISGEMNSEEGMFTASIQSKGQLMNQQFGDMCSGSCRVNQLGDFQCAPGGVFADGATMAAYTHSGTVSAIGVYVAPAIVADVLAINVGGLASGSFSADAGGSGGITSSSASSVDVSYQNSAPQSVYQTYRYASAQSSQPYGSPFSYTLSGLTSGTIYTIRLHFAEPYFPTSAQIKAAAPASITGVGMRLFNVSLNDNLLLEAYDITAQAGGKNKAVNKELTAVANTSGQIIVTITSAQDNGLICGIEVLTQPASGIVNGIAFSGPAVASGYFSYGKVTMNSGLNVGLSREIKVSYLVSGLTQIGMQEYFPYVIAIGDTATLQRGCDRLPSTCSGTFNNLINIQAEPYLPGNDQLIAVGRPPS